jgi:DNA ligase-1
MKDILNIFNKLIETSSRNEKEDILRANKDNKLFKEILKFVYNPYIVTGISAKKLNKILDMRTLYTQIAGVEELMQYLTKNNTGKDTDIATVQQFIMSQEEEFEWLYNGIATKNITAGITATTINKIYGAEFIETFNVMLAENFFEHEDKITRDFLITLKLDGNRNVALYDYTGVKMFTRQGHVNEGFGDIEADVAKYLPKGFVYDGEFISRNTKGLKSEDLYRETTSAVRTGGVKKDIVFHIFDMVHLSDFKKGYSPTPAYIRKSQLHKYMKDIPETVCIKEVPVLYHGSDKERVIELLREVLAQDEEGLMVNMAGAGYSSKRTKDLLKVKEMQSIDLRIVGFEEGEGKYKGTLGSIQVKYKGNLVKVGSGYKDEIRDFIWSNQNTLLGTIIEVQFHKESKNAKTGDASLRFPVFLRFRPDKDEESYS